MTDLLIKREQGACTLDGFVEVLPRLLGCGPWEERESSNYPPEYRYFRCIALGVEIVASIVDDSEFDQYDVQLYFSPEFWRSDATFLVELADCVARKLVVSGYEVLRPFDSSRSGKGGLLYQLDPSAGAMPWEQVITKEL